MTSLVEIFDQNASLVSALVHQVSNRAQAFEKAVALLKERPLTDPGMQFPRSSPKTNAGDEHIRTMAVPNLDDTDFRQVSQACGTAGGIRLIQQGLREYPAGVDMGLTTADWGIADTGTLVINSNNEETRLATMLCEVHVAILQICDIRETALSMADELEKQVGQTGSYTAFITGASRTADIERVLAIGVHGPLELHIILVENQ